MGSLAHDTTILMACSIPALAAGLFEDVTKNGKVAFRLAATMLAAGIAYFALDGILDHVALAPLDIALRFMPVSLLFTMVAVGGIANAINIVDGCNGLAGMVSVMILLALSFVAHQVGDAFIFGASLLLAGSIAGFLVWNFPGGRIFLGDGGAYFIGFMIAELSVLLVRRHAEVSPWFPLLIVAYPVWETLFSIYRKRFLRGMSPGEPDGMHFHMLVYKRVVRWKVTSRDPRARVERNSLTSPYLWGLTVLTILPALAFWRSTVILAFMAFGFGIFYNWLYRRMALFQVPKWLIVSNWQNRSASGASDDGEPVHGKS
jgi:UDP-N-acetylmuramyl pentapeptide phosphotransferase/UDP-N-acetylglucosamine-1-phosphate transferase